MAVKILLLEDDMQLNETIKQFLELKGYDVYAVYDGYEAEEIAYEKHIDLMLLDVKVPHLSGFDFLKNIRDSDKNIPAIFITSLNSVEDVEKGFALGCDDYIRKPFALKELLVRVESLLKRSFGTYDEKVDLGGGLFFDIKELSLTKNKRKIPLKTKELKLLALFLQHPNMLLEYEKINDTLWGYDEEPSAGSLRTYVKTIRAIIGKDKIETIKNIGYRFVAK
jgi:DNA-binding response OmpR family regulator